jgi:hypothetical protein
MPAKLRQDRDLEILVLEEQGLVAFDPALVSQPVANRVRIVEPLGGKQIERWVRVRQLLDSRRKRERPFPGAHRRPGGRCRHLTRLDRSDPQERQRDTHQASRF